MKPCHTIACRPLVLIAGALAILVALAPVHAQEDPDAGRPIRDVVTRQRVAERPGETIPVPPARDRLLRNQLRTIPGTPYDPAVTRADLQRLDRVAGFGRVEATVQRVSDGGVIVTFTVDNEPVIADVAPVGNSVFTDQKIGDITSVLIGSPVDRFEVDRAARRIEEMYREKGYYLAQVTPDLDELEETGILYFRIREGQKLKIHDIRFEAVEGRLSFSASQLRSAIRTRAVSLLEKGRLDESVLNDDVEALAGFYRDRGYRDVKVGRHVTYSPNGREAIVTFVVDEGPVYTLRDIIVYYPDLARVYPTREEAVASMREGESLLVLAGGADARIAVYPYGVFAPDQVAGLLQIKRGDVYSADKLRNSADLIRDKLRSIGYIDARVELSQKLDPDRPLVDLLLEIRQGDRFLQGEINITGNSITQDRVIRRELTVAPDRPIDGPGLAKSRERIANTRLFQTPPGPRISIIDEDPMYPGYRNVLIEVEETNTGSFEAGGAISSDLGVAARIAITQRNFDLFDTPSSFKELFSRSAFRGGGQTLSFEASPGDRVQSFGLSLLEPAVLDSDYWARGDLFFRNRIYSEYDEARYGGGVSVGRRFGSRWVGSLRTRVEWIDPSDIDPDSPVDFFAVEDRNMLTSVGVEVSRTTFDNRFFPSRGNRIEFSVAQAGALGGDFDFTHLSAGYEVYVPIYRDFYENSTVLSFKTEVNYIPQDPDSVPFYERIYRGGRSFRGFDVRAVSPVGIRADTGEVGNDPVGGVWGFFLGTEIRQPVYEDIVSIVGFVDSGTVSNEIGFQQYRLSVGFGVRIKWEALSAVPIAFDFGFPIFKEDTDDARLFSFFVDLPFQ